MKNFSKVLVANRGEIAIRVFRACAELNIRTVAIFSKEDIHSLHRFKADEAYMLDESIGAVEAYLDIEKVIQIAKLANVCAIHPGYGFLSENVVFAKRCQEEGITFIGPNPIHLDMFGDKVKAKKQAILAKIPTIPGSKGPVTSVEDVYDFGAKYGYPIIIKASLGGGGRGMRIVNDPEKIASALKEARLEGLSSFGSSEVYCEKFIEKPKHIEVQILADNCGNLVHLFERDCSIQRRYQKIIEIAPSVLLSDNLRKRIYQAAVSLMKNVNYVNAGTVEFLVSGDEFYFIEVNPRIQVEHTITEMITGIDIVQSQLLISAGHSLHDQILNIPKQSEISVNGFAIQCRITTENPQNNFMPDTGTLTSYRSPGGFGVRLDAGNAYAGSVISPFYDSLLVKLSIWNKRFPEAANKMRRTLQEFQISGVRTNIQFLEKICKHKSFIKGDFNTAFIDCTPELFDFTPHLDKTTKLLDYISHVTVNGFPNIGKKPKPESHKIPIPNISNEVFEKTGTKQIFENHGVSGIIEWIKNQKHLLITDTTFRDAHQSLLATRVRTKDMTAIARKTALLLPNLFSFEVFGGATFDASFRFLKEDPWERLKNIRQKMPNHLLQMLMRGANAVGYRNYPDNVIREFIRLSSCAGIDVFRIFDSLNWVRGMEVAIDETRKQHKIVQAAICYTGDLLDSTRRKYNLNYYKTLAKELESLGAHMITIKDMAGLLKPEAAYQLVTTLKETVAIPITLHTHDTSGNGVYTYVRAAMAGVDIVDTAIEAMAGNNSQPSLNSLYYALEGSNNRLPINISGAKEISNYWQAVRKIYCFFDSKMTSAHTEVYNHEIPGGQYSNLKQQAKGVGLEDKWEEIKKMYGTVNKMFGDIVKVTPTSKVVGDMALFMVQNKLTPEDILNSSGTINFPDSVKELFSGYLGFPEGGFPKKLQKIILQNQKPITKRAGALLAQANFDEISAQLKDALNRTPTEYEVISKVLYPEVFQEYLNINKRYGNISVLDTPTFYHGIGLGETIAVTIEEGKPLTIRLNAIAPANKDGIRTLFFELNGEYREINVMDQSATKGLGTKPKADPNNVNHIGATMPGAILKILVCEGQNVEKGDSLFVTEAMKMETTVKAPISCVIKKCYFKEKDLIQAGDLLLEIEP